MPDSKISDCKRRDTAKVTSIASTLTPDISAIASNNAGLISVSERSAANVDELDTFKIRLPFTCIAMVVLVSVAVVLVVVIVAVVTVVAVACVFESAKPGWEMSSVLEGNSSIVHWQSG